MKKSKFFADAHDEISQNYLSAEGWDEADGDFEEYSDNEMENAFGDQLEAEGGNSNTLNSGKSQPYTIVLTNTTTADISNVVILNAAAAVISGFAVSGVSFSYEPTTISYAQFLGSIVSGKVFSCNQLRMIASNASSSVVQQQVLTSLIIETKDPNGNLIQMPFIPEYDSYQFQTGQVDVTYVFNVDALTKITIATLYASTTLKVRLFPGSKINQFKQLRGKQAVSTYKNPKVNRALARRK